MLHTGTIDIETDRVLLRQFKLCDSNHMFYNWASSSLVTRFLSWEPYSEVSQVVTYIKDAIGHYIEKSYYNWAIELKELGEVIGSVNANVNEELSCVRLSFCIGDRWWNRRIMQEILTHLIPIFMERIQCERLEACTESDNRTAAKVLIRSGFHGEGILKRAYLGINGPSDLIWYSIMKNIYDVKKRLSNLTLDQLYITNYKENGGEHLKSITRLPREEAFQVAKRLSADSKSKNDRYGQYFERYYEKRLNTENKLYNQFIRNGGNPQTHHPIYFVLCENQGMANFYGSADSIKIMLDQIPSEYLSFTPRDSMHLIDMGILDGNVWRKEELFAMLSGSNRSIGEQIIEIPGMYGQYGGCIEVQVWNDRYIIS